MAGEDLVAAADLSDIAELGDAVDEPDGVDAVDADDVADAVDVADEDVPEPCECECSPLLCMEEFCNADCSDCAPLSYADFDAALADGLPAEPFSLVDVNPVSGDFGETFTLADFEGQTVLVLFHSNTCDQCNTQVPGARVIWNELQDYDDIRMVTINSVDAASEEDVHAYVYADVEEADGIPLPDEDPPSYWPVLQDTAEEDVYSDYCADSQQAYVIDANGLVRKRYTPLVIKDSVQIQNRLTEILDIAQDSRP